MNTLSKLLLAAGLAATSGAASAQTVEAAGSTIGAAAIQKNWTAPAHRMYSQALVDDMMAKRGDLLSLTLQGEPPGHKGVYTMFAGSFPERIGKVSSDVDVLVMAKGYSILDPRWNRDETPRKSVYLLPLRDRAGKNIGLTVVAFKNPAGSNKTEKDFFLAASDLRDELAKRIPSHAALFGPVPAP